jgi:RND family efflux transporter MFP subunit
MQGCKKPAAAPPTPPAVTVSHPVERDVIEWDTYTGHLEAPQSVTVAARVSGMIVDTPFVEGAIIKKGDVLYVIDERPFKSDLDSKVADQQKAQAQLEIAQLNMDRQQQALKANAVSKQDYDNAKAARDQADAALAATKAAVELSRLSLEWCKVTSPIDGRVSNKIVTVGNLINGGAGQATLLTTVQSVDPMYCYVDVDENSVLKYQKLAVEKKRVSARDAKIPCYVQLGNETGYPHAGVVDFVDNHIDTNTGTLRARGVMPNPKGYLTPGSFAGMRIPGSGRYHALLVPDTSIGSDQSQRNVLVLNQNDIVEARPVEVGALFGSVRAIISGIKPEDRIIINGQMHARPGTKVSPTEGTIQIDPSAFADPNLPTTQATTSPTTEPGANPTGTPR